MNRFVACLLALLLAVLLAGSALAGGYYRKADALDKLRLAYDSKGADSTAGYFRGYVIGIADSALGNAWCPPGKVSADRTYGIVARFMQEHPASSQQDASAVVTAALGDSFPCPDK